MGNQFKFSKKHCMDHCKGPLVSDCWFTYNQWINGLGRGEPGLSCQRLFSVSVHNPWSHTLALLGHSVQFSKCALSISLYHNSVQGWNIFVIGSYFGDLIWTFVGSDISSYHSGSQSDCRLEFRGSHPGSKN